MPRTSSPWVAAVLLAAACSPERWIAVEPSLDEPSVRVMVALSPSGGGATVDALPGSAAFERPLKDVLDREGHLEIWVFRYSLERLAEVYPALAGKPEREAAALLDPRLDGSGAEPPPSPVEVLRAVISSTSGSAITYQPIAWPDWLLAVESGRAPAFRFALTRAPDARCPPVAVRSIGPITGLRLSTQTRLAAVSDELTFLASAPSPSSDPTILARVEPAGVRRFVQASIRGAPAGMAFDHQDGLWLLTRHPSGPELPLHRLSTTSGATLAAPRISLAGQGRLLSAGLDGTVALTDGSLMVTFSAGSAAEPVTSELPSGSIRKMHVVDRTRMIAADEPAIYFSNGVFWRDEHRPISPLNLHALHGDRELLAASGTYEEVLRRDEARGTWHKMPAPVDIGSHFRSLAVLPGGRILVAGSLSALALWTGERWCRIDPSVQTSFWEVSASPSGRRAVALGGADMATPDGEPALLLLELPDP